MHRIAENIRPGLIVVLNGPSSSGKTSVARHLQALCKPRAFLHVALDAFRQMEPPDYWSVDVKDRWPERVETLCRAINAVAATCSRRGENVIVDHVLPGMGWPWMLEDFAGLPVVTIGVRCSQEELDRREVARGDRPAGLAASQADIHAGHIYEFDLDTTCTASLDCAKAVHGWLAGRAG